MPQKIPYQQFETLIQNSKGDELPEFYVVKDGSKYIGYLLLLADKKEGIPKPFSFFACHNGDELLPEQHTELLEFVRKRASEKGYKKLLWLAEHEIQQIQR